MTQTTSWQRMKPASECTRRGRRQSRALLGRRPAAMGRIAGTRIAPLTRDYPTTGARTRTAPLTGDYPRCTGRTGKGGFAGGASPVREVTIGSAGAHRAIGPGMALGAWLLARPGTPRGYGRESALRRERQASQNGLRP